MKRLQSSLFFAMTLVSANCYAQAELAAVSQAVEIYAKLASIKKEGDSEKATREFRKNISIKLDAVYDQNRKTHVKLDDLAIAINRLMQRNEELARLREVRDLQSHLTASASFYKSTWSSNPDRNRLLEMMFTIRQKVILLSLPLSDSDFRRGPEEIPIYLNALGVERALLELIGNDEAVEQELEDFYKGLLYEALDIRVPESLENQRIRVYKDYSNSGKSLDALIASLRSRTFVCFSKAHRDPGKYVINHYNYEVTGDKLQGFSFAARMTHERPFEGNLNPFQEANEYTRDGENVLDNVARQSSALREGIINSQRNYIFSARKAKLIDKVKENVIVVLQSFRTP